MLLLSAKAADKCLRWSKQVCSVHLVQAGWVLAPLVAWITWEVLKVCIRNSCSLRVQTFTWLHTERVKHAGRCRCVVIHMCVHRNGHG